jgi:hypothetical protein
MDPNRFKSPGSLLVAIRDAIEPALLSSGFRYAGRGGSTPRLRFMDFTRPDGLFTITWEHSVGVAADHLGDGGVNLRRVAFTDLEIAIADLSSAARTTAAIDVRLGPFIEIVVQYLDGLATGSTDAQT